jgi:hypothetical protein
VLVVREALGARRLALGEALAQRRATLGRHVELEQQEEHLAGRNRDRFGGWRPGFHDAGS